jgi:hypothetical protein
MPGWGSRSSNSTALATSRARRRETPPAAAAIRAWVPARAPIRGQRVRSISACGANHRAVSYRHRAHRYRYRRRLIGVGDRLASASVVSGS